MPCFKFILQYHMSSRQKKHKRACTAVPSPKRSLHSAHHKNNPIKTQNPQKSSQLTPKLIQKSHFNSMSLKQLLSQFNSYDGFGKGAISLLQAKSLFERNAFQANQFQEYYGMINSKASSITFDQLLFILRIAKSLSDQPEQIYDQFKQVDARLIQFLSLLNKYRKKKENEHNYREARRAKEKIDFIRANQLERIKKYLSKIREQEIKKIQQKQLYFLQELIANWDKQTMEYEATAASLIREISQKQNKEMQNYANQLQQELTLRVHFSKKVVDLIARQNYLAKQQQYSQAEELQNSIAKLKHEQLLEKQKKDARTIAIKCEGLRKKHLVIIKSLMQNIQKDQIEQIEQHKKNTQKLLVRKKAVLSQINNRHEEAIKCAYEALHNIVLDDRGLNV